MLSIDSLKQYGADSDTGVRRCVGKEDLYLKLVKTIPIHPNFEQLNIKIAAKDFEGAFQAAHGLKGATANLSLTPLYEPISEITELLRSGADVDYSSLLQQIQQAKKALAELCQD